MITEHSIWEEETVYKTVDFIIVGAGLMGLWTAIEIKKRQHLASIIILEKELSPKGASTRNAGFACFGSPTEMLFDSKTMGEDDMWSTVALRYDGIKKIRDTFGDTVIDFDACGGYECLKWDTAEIVNERLDWINQGMKSITDIPNCFTWSNEKMQDYGLTGFDAMIENRLEGGLHSGKLVEALTAEVLRNGIRINRGVSVKEVVKGAMHSVVHSNTGSTYKAKYVIYCINAFTSNLTETDEVIPARGQMLLTKPIPGMKLKSTFHFDEGFYYFRNLGDRLLIGGGRNADFANERTTEFGTTAVVQNALERFISTHILPATTFTITHRWSGIMGFTANKKPLVAEVGGNALAVVACNGMGVALTPMIAEQVAAYF